MVFTPWRLARAAARVELKLLHASSVVADLGAFLRNLKA